MSSPITPADVIDGKVIPDEIIKSFNEVIQKNWNGEESTFKQKDIVANIVDSGFCVCEAIFANHWLDIEALYEKSGWLVKYDKPGFSEDYDAYFTFKPKKK